MSNHMKEAAVTGHYAEEYFENYQKEYGEFGGTANMFMFEKHVAPHDAVLDFGCGGGFLLKNLNCAAKTGVEINPVAREYCNRINGIACCESLDSVPDASIDVVLSSHCLEHTTNPFDLVALMFEKLKPGGRIVIVVPLESHKLAWTPANVDNHLYSFSPMNLGNILQATGFTNIKTEVVLHKWIPGFRRVSSMFGMNTFHQLSWLYGRFVNRRCVQVKGSAVKPVSRPG